MRAIAVCEAQPVACRAIGRHQGHRCGCPRDLWLMDVWLIRGHWCGRVRDVWVMDVWLMMNVTPNESGERRERNYGAWHGKSHRA